MRYEPALLIAALVGVINFVVHLLGWDWIDSDAAEGLATLVATLIGGWLIRQRVTPVAKLQDRGVSVPPR